MLIFFSAIAIIFLIVFSAYKRQDEAEEEKKESLMTQAELDAYKIEKTKNLQESKLAQSYGHINQQLVCPHCQIKGKTRILMQEKILTSKTKAILSIKIQTTQKVTSCHCDNCNMNWDVI